MWLCDHGSPQLTGHPLLLYDEISGAAGWAVARPLGHISPYLPMSSLTGISAGKAEPSSIFSRVMFWKFV